MWWSRRSASGASWTLAAEWTCCGSIGRTKGMHHPRRRGCGAFRASRSAVTPAPSGAVRSSSAPQWSRRVATAAASSASPVDRPCGDAHPLGQHGAVGGVRATPKSSSRNPADLPKNGTAVTPRRARGTVRLVLRRTIPRMVSNWRQGRHRHAQTRWPGLSGVRTALRSRYPRYRLRRATRRSI